MPAINKLPEAGQTVKGSIEGPSGSLETEISAPEEAAGGVAVICHPHPQHGGTKDNKVVYTLARACREAGLIAVRFNFRGVGASEGVYDEGNGETEDALAVAEWALQQAESETLVWAGFSFGAGVALRAAMQKQPFGLATIALPTRYFEKDLPRPDCPWLAVHGDADDVVDTDAAIKSLNELSPTPEIETLSKAGHFFHGQLTELGEIIGKHLPRWL